VLVVLVGNMGLYFFSLLREAPGEGGAVLCGMVSLYACIPVLWGVCLRSEAVRPLKLLGVALSLSATLLLGLSSGGGLGGGGGGGSALLVGAGAARRVALFLAAITCWGLCDVGSARLGRDTPFAHTALLGAIGQAVFGCAFALGSAAGGRGAPAGADAAAAPAAAVLWLSLANVAGVVGWLAFILAGRGGEVSALAPLTSLYVFLPVLVSTARGEVLTRGQAAGMGLAAVGAVLVGWGWGAAATAAPPPPAPPPPLTPSPAACAEARGRRARRGGGPQGVGGGPAGADAQGRRDRHAAAAGHRNAPAAAAAVRERPSLIRKVNVPFLRRRTAKYQ
jgi:drug/metabolite transporter (DMT)-like permease